MICQDCASAADQRADVEHPFLDAALRGHDRCFERNLGRPSTDCACQHRIRSSEVTDGR